MKKFLKKVGVFFLIFIAGVTLFSYQMLDTSEKLIQKDTVLEFIKNIDISDMLGEEVKDKLYETLDKTGMPREYADYVLESDEFKEYMGEYVSSGIDYLVYDKEVPKLDKEETTNMFVTSFENIIKEAEKNNLPVEDVLSKEEQEEIISQIEEYTPELIEKIPEVEEFVENKLKENPDYQDAKKSLEEIREDLQKSMEALQFMFAFKIVIFVILLIEFALLIWIGWKSLKFFKNIGFVFLGNAVILLGLQFVISYGMNRFYPKKIEFMKSAIETFTSKMQHLWFTAGITYGIIAIVLFVIQIGIAIYKKKKEDQLIQAI